MFAVASWLSRLEAWHLNHDLLHAVTRIAVQLVAGASGWLLVVVFAGFGLAVAVPLVFVTFLLLEMVRAKRFGELYAKTRLMIKRHPYKEYYWASIIIAVIVGAVGIILVVLTRINTTRSLYIVLVAITLWPEVWIALNRHEAE